MSAPWARRRPAGRGRWLAAPLGLMLSVAAAAEPIAPVPPEAPSAAELVTRRRAAEAAKAYAESTVAAGALEPALAERISEIEMLVTEGEAFLAAGRPLKAGDCAIAAAERWGKLTPAERVALAARGKAAQAKITALSRALAGPDGLTVPPPLSEVPPAEKPTHERKGDQPKRPE